MLPQAVPARCGLDSESLPFPSSCPEPFCASARLMLRSNSKCATCRDLSTAFAANRNTTIACSVIQPEAVVLDVQKALGHERHQVQVRWRHPRLFEQRISTAAIRLRPPIRHHWMTFHCKSNSLARFRLCVALSEGGFSNVGHLDPLRVRRGLGVVVVVPVPPLVRRRLGVTPWRVLPNLLTAERRDVEVAPGGPHRLVAAVVDEVGTEKFVAVAAEC